MGVWGTGISSNDTFADVYGRFFELYNDGMSVADASAKVIRENRETVDILEDAPNFWYALAKAQWECKELSTDILEQVQHYVQSGEDIRIWKDLGGAPSDINSRRKALEKFLYKLQSEKTFAKKRKKTKLYDSLYRKGDCLVYVMDNGNYGGSFVLTDEQMTLGGVNYIAITTIDTSEKPTIDDFRNANVYLRYAENVYIHEGEIKRKWEDKPEISGYSALTAKLIDFDIKVIGNIPVQNEFHPRTISVSPWIWLRKLLPLKDEYERLRGKATSTLKLAKWLKKPFLSRLIPS